MKYAFMTFSTPEATFEHALELARRYGYDGIEPRAEAKHRHGVELGASTAARKQIRAQAKAAGIAVACVATSCTYADPKTAPDNTRKTHEYIDLAADLGAARIRVFGGKVGAGLSREQAIDTVAKALGSVAEHARERGVAVCVETHDDWCDPNHVADVMRRVGQSAIGVNWDIMHPVRTAGYTVEAAFRALRTWVQHVHFHDGTREADKVVLKPIGEGMIDHGTAVRLLLEARYGGYLSGEWINWEIGSEIHLPAELEKMRGFERRQP